MLIDEALCPWSVIKICHRPWSEKASSREYIYKSFLLTPTSVWEANLKWQQLSNKLMITCFGTRAVYGSKGCIKKFLSVGTGLMSWNEIKVKTDFNKISTYIVRFLIDQIVCLNMNLQPLATFNIKRWISIQTLKMNTYKGTKVIIPSVRRQNCLK